MGRVRSAMDRVDERVGDAIEHLLRRHHARRLRRLGWGSVLEEGVADPPVGFARTQAGNRVEVLIDGQEALPAIREAIESARHSVHVANWHATADFRLTREPDAPTLRELLTDASRRIPVRVLLWAGPPVPAFQPTRVMAKAECDALTRNSQVRCVLDARERTMHCHHEKLVVVDDRVAFVGGMDFTALDGDRHDSSEHNADRPMGWHDLMARLHGPVVADVAEHFRQRWNEVADDRLPAPHRTAPAGGSNARLVRTVPEKTYDFAPRGEFSILDTYVRALRSARRLIYLENQFLWSPEIADILMDKLCHPPDPDLRVVLLLPRKPSNGADTTRGQLGRLIEADEQSDANDGVSRLLAVTLNTHDRGRTAPVYVHAKLGIVDDTWMSVGSANLNEHSLFNDTEVNVVTDDTALIRDTRLRLWAEHLQRAKSDVDGDSTDVVDRLWRPTAEEQADRIENGLPGTHRLTLLPSISRRAGRLQGPLRGLLVDG